VPPGGQSGRTAEQGGVAAMARRVEVRSPKSEVRRQEADLAGIMQLLLGSAASALPPGALAGGRAVPESLKGALSWPPPKVAARRQHCARARSPATNSINDPGT